MKCKTYTRQAADDVTRCDPPTCEGYKKYVTNDGLCKTCGDYEIGYKLPDEGMPHSCQRK